MTNDELNQRYDPMNRAELIAECERLLALLRCIESLPDEENEWDAVEQFRRARQVAAAWRPAHEPPASLCGAYHPYAQRRCELAKGHTGDNEHGRQEQHRATWAPEKSPVQTLECPVCRTVHDLPLCPE
jgi:hypothetical protein